MNKETIVKDYQDYKETYDSIEDKNSNAALQLMGAMNALEHLCPELKESDGDKIRKEIIAILKYKFEHYPKDPKYSNAPQWIAWLEKQGEKDEEILVLKDQIESLHAAIKAMKETHKVELEKQGGQKPAWSEEDDANLIRALAFIENTRLKDVDEIKESVLTWLKSLKGRVQPKQEWNEEDEKMIENIIDYMMPMPIFFKSTKGESGKEYTKEFIKDATDWLKNLKKI